MKRTFDFGVSLVALMVLLPLIFMLVLLIRWKLGMPVFFRQVRPGITGWAQVNGRNAISWEEKFKLDVRYVDNRSLGLDLKILFLTVKKVFVREGISAIYG